MSERNPTREQDFVSEGLAPPGEATENRDKQTKGVRMIIAYTVKVEQQGFYTLREVLEVFQSLNRSEMRVIELISSERIDNEDFLNDMPLRIDHVCAVGSAEDDAEQR